jgi:hypothetical protein
MSVELLSIPAPRMRRTSGLARYPHGVNIGDMCARHLITSLASIPYGQVALNRCKGCNRPVGPLPNYCAECTQEDETDCW